MENKNSSLGTKKNKSVVVSWLTVTIYRYNKIVTGIFFITKYDVFADYNIYEAYNWCFLGYLLFVIIIFYQ